jgi:hypothetical protein
MKRKNRILLSLALLLVILILISFYFFYNYYRKNYEKIILKRFIQENLKENYYPKNLNVEHRLISTGETIGSDTLYGAIWYINETKFYANLHYNLSNSKIFNSQIFIFSKEIPDELDKEKASSLFDKYFKTKNEAEIKCKTPVTHITYCEKFWVEANGNKKGMAVIVGTFNGIKDKIIGLCQYPKGSERYETETCLQVR